MRELLTEGMRKRLPELCPLDIIREGKNIVMTGNPGTGKTHTAIGLGIKACEQGYKVLFTTIPYLVTEFINIIISDGRLDKITQSLTIEEIMGQAVELSP